MTRASFIHRSGSSLRALIAALGAVIALGAGIACDRNALGPKEVGPDGRAIGRVAVVVPIGNQQATAVTVTVSAVDIPTPMVFNFLVSAGVASGSIAVPAGANRLITVSAFDGAVETHRGTTTLTISAGTNPTTSITLAPLAGTVPITATFGSVVITITPATASPKVGDTLRFSATIRDASGTIVPGPARWASTNPAKVTLDTAGLATVLDTGNVLVVATYSTTAATASLALQPAAGGFVPGFLRTWVGGAGTGSQRTDWANANNWSPSFVPTQNDSVVIGAATNQPFIQIDTFSVRDLVLRTGASLSATCCGQVRLRVGRVVSGEGGGFGSFFGGLLMRNGSSLLGTVNTLIRLFPSSVVVLADSARIGSLALDTAGATLDLAGKRLSVIGTVTVRNGALLQIDGANDTLDVGGNMDFQSNAAPHVTALTAGTVILRGVSNSMDGYAGTGAQTVVFAGTAQQTLYNMDNNARPTNTLPNVVVSGAGGVALYYYNIRILGSFDVKATAGAVTGYSTSYPVRVDGPVTTALGSSVGGANLTMDLRHPTGTANVLGLWSPGYTDFRTPNTTVKSGLGYQNMRLYASQVFADSVRVGGLLSIDGASTVLAITAPRRIIASGVTLSSGATVVLDEPGDTLEVLGNFSTSGGGNSSGKFTDGVLLARGDVDGSNYTGTGKHQLVLANTGGTPQRTINFNAGATPPTKLSFLKVANSGGHDVCYYGLKVDSAYMVTTAVPVTSICGGYGLDVGGPISTVVGSSMNLYQVTLRHPSGTSNVNGTWNPTYTDVAVADAILKPSLAYNELRFFASDSLPAGATMNINGSLVVDGVGTTLAMRGARVNVVGNLTTQSGGRLNMVNGDTLTVNGQAAFNSAAASLMSGGQLSLLGLNHYLYTAGYTPSGSHKVRFANPTVQATINGTTLAKPIPRVEVASPFGLMMNGDMAVSDTFAITASGPNVRVTSSYVYTLHVDNAFITSAQSALYPYNLELAGVSTLNNVNGTYAPGYTSVFTATPGALRNAPGIQYSNVNFHVAYTLTDTLTTTVNTLAPYGPYVGNVAIYNTGTILDLNGKRVRLSGGFDANTNAILKMVNPLDTLMVGDGSTNASGNLYLDGGANSLLSDGTIILRGSAYLTNVASAANHKLVVTDSGLPAAARTWALNSTSTLGSVVVRGSSALTVSINANYTLLGSFDLQGGATFTSGYYYTWRVNGPVTTAINTAVLAGPYVGAFAMQLGHVTGTANVNGTWSPGVTEFVVAGATIKPTLAYQSLNCASSCAFSGRTTMTRDLSANGAGTVLDIAGQTVSAAGNFGVGSGAVLKMTAALDRDTLFVAGNFTSDNGQTNSIVTAGAIRVRGDVYGFRLAPTGTSTMILDSLALAQPQAFNNNNQSWNKVRVITNRYVRLDNYHTFNDSVQILSPATFGYTTYSGNIYSFLGPLSAVPSSIVIGGQFQLYHPSGTSLINGQWTPSYTRMMAAGQVIKPTLAYQNFECNASCTFSGPTTINGYLYATGTSTVVSTNANVISVANYFKLNAGATLQMTSPADTLAVSNYFDSDNSQVNSVVTDGVIRVKGDVNANRLNPTGASKIVLDSLASGAVQNFYTSITPINRLQVRTQRTVQMNNSMTFVDSLVISTPTVVGYPNAQNFTFNGPVSSVAGGTLQGGYMRFQHVSAADNVLGFMTMSGELQLAASSGTPNVPVAPGRFTYNYLRIALGSAFLPLGANLQLGPGGGQTYGTLYVDANATLTIPSTATLHACSDIQINTSANPGIINNSGILQSRVAVSGAVFNQIFGNAPATVPCL